MPLVKVALALASVLQLLDSVPLAQATTYGNLLGKTCNGVVGPTTDQVTSPTVANWSPMEDGVLPAGITYCACGDYCSGYLNNWSSNDKSGQFYLPCTSDHQGNNKNCCPENAKVIYYSHGSYQINSCTFH